MVIRKPTFPAEAFRAPSGGVHPGESLEEGALREALEETGLGVRLVRYLLRVDATLRPGIAWHPHEALPPEVLDPADPGAVRWQTHVFLACVEGENRQLAPRDTWEIAEARWVTFDELQGRIRRVLLETGWSLFRYRVALTDAVVALLDRGSGLSGRASGSSGAPCAGLGSKALGAAGVAAAAGAASVDGPPTNHQSGEVTS